MLANALDAMWSFMEKTIRVFPEGLWRKGKKRRKKSRWEFHGLSDLAESIDAVSVVFKGDRTVAYLFSLSGCRYIYICIYSFG